jgi:hypothetical protein
MRGTISNTITGAVKRRAGRLADNLERFQTSRLISVEQTVTPRVETDLPQNLSDAIVDSADYDVPRLPEPKVHKDPSPLPSGSPRPAFQPGLPVRLQFQTTSSGDVRSRASRRRLKTIP